MNVRDDDHPLSGSAFNNNTRSRSHHHHTPTTTTTRAGEKGHKISVKKSSSLSTDASNGIIKEMKCIMILVLEMCRMHALTSAWLRSLLTVQQVHAAQTERNDINCALSFYSRNVQQHSRVGFSLSLTALL
jgi:hypothetical protein